MGLSGLSRAVASDLVVLAHTPVFDIDNGAGKVAHHSFVLPRTYQVLEVRAVYVEPTAKVDAATFRVWLLADEVDIVGVTPLANNAALGDVTVAPVLTSLVPAETVIVVQHTGIAGPVAGQYYVQFWGVYQ